MTGKRFCLRRVQFKLQASDSFRTILSYLGSKAVIKFQALSKVFYEKHVPKVMDSIHSYAFMSSLLNSRHFGILKGYFSQSPKFTLLYVGSQHEFKSRMFHELCDNRGPTISVVRTEFNHTFGFYTSVAWESSGNYKLIPNARTFMFKLLSEEQITKLDQKGDSADVFHYSSRMCATNHSILINDNANQVQNIGVFSTRQFQVPEGLTIDNKTFLGGAQQFKISEIEVYLVQS